MSVGGKDNFPLLFNMLKSMCFADGWLLFYAQFARYCLAATLLIKPGAVPDKTGHNNAISLISRLIDYYVRSGQPNVQWLPSPGGENARIRRMGNYA